MSLRGYRRADLRAMHALDIVCFAEPFRFSLSAMRRFAEASSGRVVLAEQGAPPGEGVGSGPAARLLGFVITHGERGGSYVVTLDVAPEQRRRGVAGALMDRAEELSAGSGERRMELHVYAGNESAIRFYEARGYVRVGLERSFYGTADGVPLDALVYRKELRRV